MVKHVPPKKEDNTGIATVSGAAAKKITEALPYTLRGCLDKHTKVTRGEQVGTLATPRYYAEITCHVGDLPELKNAITKHGLSQADGKSTCGRDSATLKFLLRA